MSRDSFRTLRLLSMRESRCCWWRRDAGRDSGRWGEPETGCCSSPELPARRASFPYKSDDLEDGKERSSDLMAAPSLKCSLLFIPVRGGGGMGAVEEMSPG